MAHVAVQQGPLPPDFDLWALRDNCGFNVAETACIHGNLPEGVNDWRELIASAREMPEWDIVPLPPPLPLHFRFAIVDPCLITISDIPTGIARGEDFRVMLGLVLDMFYRWNDKPYRSMVIESNPADMPERWQVPFLGATAAVLARRFDLDVPTWTRERRCFLPIRKPYFPHRLAGERLKPPPSTPPEFAERNVFVSGYVLYRG
ncbi:MAG: hypothetical protein LBG06_11680 [Deltaproteobacteria bacterium]|nr:hypothetical protein [Deltaproteobacteria bacterium]